MIVQPGSHRIKTIWAETKYDGIRCVPVDMRATGLPALTRPVIRVQIHVWKDAAGQPVLRLFSKSKRDSTLDRLACHS